MAPQAKPYNTLSPMKLSHIVLRTQKFEEMKDFYQKFLGAHIEFGNEVAAFLRYDDEHHRIGIMKLDGLTGPSRTTCGLEHVAFTFGSVADLLKVWQQRRELGIEPEWCVNHGATTSMYYRDPDGNQLESQVDNFDTSEDAQAFIMSKDFRDNPVGSDFDPEDHLKRLESGESETSIKKRVEVGPRSFPTAVLPVEVGI